MPGTPAGSSFAACGMLPVFQAAPSGTGIFASIVFPWNAGRIGGMEFNVVTGGTTTANVIDVRINGTSIWTNTADRPTLGVGVSGRMTQAPPNSKGLRYGDLLTVHGVTNGSGAANLSGAVALERA